MTFCQSALITSVMAAGSYTVVNPGSSGGTVNVGQGGVLAPWYIDANGNFRNDSAADFSGNTIWMGPSTAAGIRFARNGAGVAQIGLADLSANAQVNGYKFAATNNDGSTQFSDATSAGAAGLQQYFDGSNTAANVYSVLKRSRVLAVSKAANYTVLKGDTGSTFDNNGATGTINFTLPAATLGQWFTFCTVAAQIVSVTPNSASDTIVLGSKAAGAAITSTAAKGGYLTLACTSANTWAILAVSSTPSWS